MKENKYCDGKLPDGSAICPACEKAKEAKKKYWPENGFDNKSGEETKPAPAYWPESGFAPEQQPKE